jgi:hypothetical protein
MSKRIQTAHPNAMARAIQEMIVSQVGTNAGPRNIALYISPAYELEQHPCTGHSEFLEHRFAGSFAALASFGAHPAMLMMRGVLLTLLTANTASFRAGLQSRPRRLRLEGRLAREYLSGGVAHVGAVEVETYAADQHLYVLLAEAGVGAGGAGLGTVKACLYALHQYGGVHRGGAGVSLEHLLGVGHDTSFLWLMC